MIDSGSFSGGTKYKLWKESSMGRHDLYNFESKIDYSIGKSDKKKTVYFLDTYFFIPKSLQINKETYSKEQFFSDLNNRIRFKTPKMTIKGLVDEKNDLSPINTIMKNLKLVEFGNLSKKILIQIRRELRLLACIIKASLRDTLYPVIKENDGSIGREDRIQLIISTLNHIEKLQEKIKHLKKRFLIVQIPEKVKESFQLSSEYISYQIELWMTIILNTFEKELDGETRKRIIKIIEYEQDYKETIKSRLILSTESDNEGYSYWEGILKKYVQSVLYLEKKTKDPKSTSLEILYSIAAGVAMFFSLFLGFLILQGMEQYSISFLITAVVIYMLKDRIKDNVRTISNKAVGLFFPDRRTEIVDGFNEELIGESIEKVNFIPKEKVPPEILQIRRASNITQIEEKGKPEDIILYRKKIVLFNRKIEEYHRRRKEFSDVMRFNIKQFLRYTDDPIQKSVFWNKETRTLEDVLISKVYHLNVIFRLTAFKDNKIKNVFYKKFRVILDQNGIKRVEIPSISL
ncbi:MAG: hypothetical protein ACP6IY_12490 [Promethearchaeia archaeon]